MLDKLEKFMHPNDINQLAFDMDFVGLQVYTRELVNYSLFVPFVQANIVKASRRFVHHTIMDWEVFPDSIYHAVKRIEKYSNIKDIIITENGAAFDDSVNNDRVADLLRKDYLQKHIKKLLKAKKEGSNIKGYFVWTLMDNFEWAEGFKPRFGLVHLDYKTQKRIIKDSGIWYKDFLT